jgi:hypothetical protein
MMKYKLLIIVSCFILYLSVTYTAHLEGPDYTPTELELEEVFDALLTKKWDVQRDSGACSEMQRRVIRELHFHQASLLEERDRNARVVNRSETRGPQQPVPEQEHERNIMLLARQREIELSLTTLQNIIGGFILQDLCLVAMSQMYETRKYIRAELPVNWTINDVDKQYLARQIKQVPKLQPIFNNDILEAIIIGHPIILTDPNLPANHPEQEGRPIITIKTKYHIRDKGYEYIVPQRHQDMDLITRILCRDDAVEHFRKLRTDQIPNISE